MDDDGTQRVDAILFYQHERLSYHMSTYMGNAIERCLQAHVSFSRCQICVLPHVFILAQVSPII